jgi:hypothetical protein
VKQIALSVCPACASNNLENGILRRVYRHTALPTPVNASFAICRSCGFLFQDNPVDDTGLAAYYAAKTQFRADELHPVEVRVHEKQSAFISSAIEVTGKLVLEIGAASGKFLDHLKSKYGCETYFDEMSAQQRATLQSKGHRPTEQAAKVDLAVMCHVLEHIVDPVPYLNSMRDKAKAIFIEVPDWSFADTDTDPINFEHVNHFSAATLSLALERAGWAVIRLEVDRTPGYSTTPFRVLRAVAKPRLDGSSKDLFVHHVDRTETKFLRGFETLISERGPGWKVGFYAASWLTDFILSNAKGIGGVRFAIFDRDPSKQASGWFGNLVKPPDAILSAELDTVIIMSSYEREMRETLSTLGYKGEVLSYTELGQSVDIVKR